jgi:hypothetical protein
VTRRTRARVTRDTSRACGCRAAARGKVHDPLENDAMAVSLDAEIRTAHERFYEAAGVSIFAYAAGTSRFERDLPWRPPAGFDVPRQRPRR